MALQDQQIGQIACDIPGATRVFHEHKLDFCCGGGHSLREAAAKRGADINAVTAALERLQADALEHARLAQRVAQRVDRTHPAPLSRQASRTVAGTRAPRTSCGIGSWRQAGLPARSRRSSRLHGTGPGKSHDEGRADSLPNSGARHLRAIAPAHHADASRARSTRRFARQT